MDIFWGTITVLGYLLTLSLVPVALLMKKEQPVSSVAWILTILMLPIVGGVLFLVFGINRVQRRAARKQQASRAVARNVPELSQYQVIPGENLRPQQDRLMRLAHRVADTVATEDNTIEVLADTNRTLGLIERAIRSARHSLHLEYYIWRTDATGTRLRDLLIEKAREGVQVRFLYDKLGSLTLTDRFLEPMREVGIDVASFLPGPSLRERWSINLRNHRKIVLVDGRVGFTGGMNIGDEYLGRNPELGFWRDTHLKISGPVVLQLQQVFVEDWYYATGEELTRPDIFPPPDETGPTTAQLIIGEPVADIQTLHALMFAAINEACEQVILSTSYFVPPASLMMALEAASYRGVRVRLLLAGRSAHPWTVIAGRSYYDSLLAAGVEIYEYDQGLMHAKVLSIDGNWSLVGTPNFDTRSLMLNFEVAVAIYDARLASQLEAHFERDLTRAKRIDPALWSNRPIRKILAENVCRLFAPML